MKSRPRVLLVAKPWRGGLAAHIARALHEALGEGACWLPSYPANAAQRIAYLRNRAAWRACLLERIASERYDAALFVNHHTLFRQLPHDPRRVLWLTDEARVDREDLAPYGRVFVSDAGHAEPVLALAGAERFAGVAAFAHAPSLHFPPPVQSARRDVCFIGNRDPARDRHLLTLLDLPASSTIVGNYFLRSRLFWFRPASFRPAVQFTEMGDVYARHRISLNVHAAVVRQGTNMRTFECAGFGIPQLVQRRPGIEQYFEPDSEIALYEGPEELPFAIARLLADPRAAQAMAERARRRALAEHSYRHRLCRLLEGLVAPLA